MTAAIKICIDCDAAVEGKATRCLACNKARTLEKNKAAAARYLARKRAGTPPTSNALVPAGGAASGLAQVEGFLASYDDVNAAVAELVNVPAAKTFMNKAAAVQDFAFRAQNFELERNAAKARLNAFRQAGFVLMDMQETGELRRSRQRGHSGSDTEPLPPTLNDLNISKKFSSDAQALARMDDFDGRMAQWSIQQEEKGGRVTLLKPVRPKERKENDAYMSPHSMIWEVCARWEPSLPGEVVEPCCGNGFFADALEAAGHDVLRSDITQGHDFFKLTKAPALKLCTNPPFKCFDKDGEEIKGQRIRDFITHAFAIGFVEVAMIIPERMFACGEGFEFFKKHKPALFAQMRWREDYLDKGGSPDRMLAVAIWTSPCAERCDYEIWSRENQPSGEEK